MNTKEVEWARAHDWYKGHRMNNDYEYSVIVKDYITQRDGTAKMHLLEFKQFDLLKQWAGY